MANDKKSGAAIGVGIAAATAAAAAAAGAYWLYGAKDAAKNRKKAKSFMLKARADVMDAVSQLNDIDKTKYMDIVDQVVKRYSSVAGITAAEVAQMTRDLRAAWTHMNAVRQTAKSVRKPASKKASKKAAPKKKAAKRK